MAKLYFHYGTMNSGKTVELIRAAYNYQERGMHPFVIKPRIDTKGEAKITSRIGAERKVDLLVSSDLDIFEELSEHLQSEAIDCIFVDEAQFLAPAQIDQLFKLTLPPNNIPVMAYGLRNDFRTKGFPGSNRLLEIAHVIKEIRTVCNCGKAAVLNARMKNGQFVTTGTQVSIDNEDGVTYEAICGTCYTYKVGPISNNQTL